MKILSNISRFLLALIVTILGLNGFLHFILGTTLASNYLLVFFALQLISGVLLLINRYVPLALTILSPIMMNVLLYGVLMNPARLGFAFLSRSCGSLCWSAFGRPLPEFLKQKLELNQYDCVPAGRVSP
jgi:putative oxidoreductase